MEAPRGVGHHKPGGVAEGIHCCVRETDPQRLPTLKCCNSWTECRAGGEWLRWHTRTGTTPSAKAAYAMKMHATALTNSTQSTSSGLLSACVTHHFSVEISVCVYGRRCAGPMKGSGRKSGVLGQCRVQNEVYRHSQLEVASVRASATTSWDLSVPSGFGNFRPKARNPVISVGCNCRSASFCILH